MARVYWGCEMESPSYIEIEQQFKHKPDDKQERMGMAKRGRKSFKRVREK
jgi:hypothetical protein